MTKKRNFLKSWLWTLAGLLCAAIFACGLFTLPQTGTEQADAFTSTTVNSATKVANGTDLWNSSTKTLNKTVVDDLKAKLFGSESPSAYIKSNADANELKWGNGYVVPATTINAKVNNATHGLVIKVGGLNWLVSSLTISNTNRVVVTLYLADQMTPVLNALNSNRANVMGYNMYSASNLRKSLLAGTGDYSSLAMFSGASGTFASQYLIQPKNIQYQLSQTMRNRGSSYNYDFPNDSLNSQTGFSTSQSNPYGYQRGYSFNGTSLGGMNAKYEDWGEDYIWLPSVTEVGVDKIAPSTCIWKLTNEQKKTTTSYTWLRSGDMYVWGEYVAYGANGDWNEGSTYCSNNSYHMRPAIHFNLDAAGLAVPQDVEKVYTGKALDCTDQDWFDATTHGNSSVVSMSAPTMRDCGTYTVTFNIISSDTNIIWADGTRESKSIKFKITQKPITLTADTSGGGVVFKIDAGQIADGDSPPEIGLRYYDSSGQTLLDYTPNSKGTYIAEAFILNGEDSNYKLAATYRQSFEITAIAVAVPTVTGNLSQSYTGSNIEFQLANYDASVLNAPVIKTAGMEMIERDGNIILSAKDAKQYEIQFSLRNISDYCWETGGTGTKSLYLTITSRPLTLTFARENNNWQWDTGTNGQFTVSHDGVDGDNIALNISYIKPDGTKILADRTSVAGKTTTVTLSALDRGEYTIVAELAPAQANVNSNGNYTLRQEYRHSFTVVGRTSTMPELRWQISVGGVVSSLSAGQAFTYTGGEFTVSLDTSDFPANGVDIKRDSWQNNRYTVVGSYTTSVTITAYDSGWEFTDQTVQISWSIAQAKYDLSKTKWDYDDSAPRVFNGSAQQVTLINLPAGLSALYDGSYMNASGDSYYRTALLTLTNSDTANYMTPIKGVAGSYIDDPDHPFQWEIEWRIVKKPIDLNWTMVSAKDSNGKTFQYPTLATDANRVIFTFRDASEQEIAFSAITVRQGFEDRYSVEVSLNEDYAANYVLRGSLTKFPFTIGKVGTAVEIRAITNSGIAAYTGQPQKATFTFSDGTSLVTDDFTLTYFEGEIQLDGAPVNAGTYKVRFNLKAGESTNSYFIDGEDTFDFEIIKATLDTSQVKWNYSDPYPYALEKGAAKVYEVRLVNLPEYLEGLVSYVGAQQNSSVSSNNLKAVFADYDTRNYNEWTLPEGLITSDEGVECAIVWQIVPRELVKPRYTGGKLVYDGAERNLFELVRFPEDKDTYITVTVTKSGDSSYNGSNLVMEAGRYVVTCRIKDEFGDNVVWTDGDMFPQSAIVEITPLELVVTGWSSKPARPVFENGSVKSSFYSVTYSHNGKEITLKDLEDAKYHGEIISAKVTIPVNMENNVTLRLKGCLDTTEFKLFGIGSDTKYFAKPTLEFVTVEYDGEEHEFVLRGVNVKYMNVSGSLFRTDVGKGVVTITLNPKEDVKWKIEEGDDGDEYGAVVLEYEITKGRISAEQEDWDSGEMPPVLRLEGAAADAVEYIYQNMSGIPVAFDKLRPNTKYNVIARIKEGFEDKFGFMTGDSYLSDTSEAFEFTFILQVELPALKEAVVVYNGETHEITIESFEGFNEAYLVITGTVSFVNAGEYQITLSIKEGSGAVWKTGGTDDKTVKFTISKAQVTVVWDAYSYRTPKATVEGLPANAFVYEYVDVLTGAIMPSAALADGASYNTRIRLTGTYATNYMFGDTQSEVSGDQFFAFSTAKPVDPTNPVVGGEGNNPSDDTIRPLPQIIISGVALVLIIVFLSMTLNYVSVVKNATEKRKKLAQISYSVSPVGLLALLFGISETNWWIVAGVLMGVALVMAIVMFMYRGKSKKALALLEEEKERVEQEKEYAKEERQRMEQQRRDEEMKMMFAAMQQNSQSQMQYGDMRSMLAETVSALLPAIQQMQALPPAASDPSAYANPPYAQPPQYDAAPQYAPPVQQPYAQPAPPQYAQPAPASNETDALRAQIAQQQELLNQILQNQQQQQTQQNAYQKPEYQEAYADDLSWLGDNDEINSLEMLYGNLSDERKMYYYEIGSYIMNKPRTVQNDGKYAVLFKYRGKTLFKLCIANDAPVLYYPSGNGGRDELQIVNASILETAKAMIDRLLMKTDQEMG